MHEHHSSINVDFKFIDNGVNKLVRILFDYSIVNIRKEQSIDKK